jgi:glucose-1-phosphate cytidylyltransferase
VTLIDTGLNTMTGGRVKRIQKYVGNETFLLTYGDGVSDIDINDLLAFHRSHGKLATISMYNVGQRFGVIERDESGRINAFREKSDDDGTMINIGFMVFEPGVFDYLEGDETVLEKAPLERLAADGQLMGYIHKGFWSCMDTLRDRNKLEAMWNAGNAPWRTWDND